MSNKKINLNISEKCEKLKKNLNKVKLPKELSDLSNTVITNCFNMQKNLNDLSKSIDEIDDWKKSIDNISSVYQKGLYTGEKTDVNQTGGKKIRKHRGIHQTGGKAGKLKKGYKYSGKKLKNGLPQIVKAKSKKNKKQTGGKGLHPPLPPYPPHPYPPHPYPYPYPYPYPVMEKKTEINK